MINERYIIKKKLGQGRSAVYLCTDSEYPGKEIALKILPGESPAEELQSFNTEYFILRRLNHPSIIKANELGTVVKISADDTGITTGCRYLAMEYFEGVELKEFPGVKEEKKLREIIGQLCSVLFYLHQSNYIYYDLKLENVLVAYRDGKPVIKLIDLGLARFMPDAVERSARGTAEYIAPEILRNDEYDHRIDLYSLGILLYRLMYDKFPFETQKELDIYKSHLEAEFQFPASDFTDDLIAVLKKLLNKEPALRYANSLQVLADLGIELDRGITENLLPASVFSNRKDVLTIVNKYLQDNESGEVFSLKGSEGAGKTTIIDEIYSNVPGVIFLNEDKSKKGADFVRMILKRIIYSPAVYPILSEPDRISIEKTIGEISPGIIDELKAFFNKYAAKSNITLLMDGFSFYDEFTLEVLKNILPILQVNKAKILICENTDLAAKSYIINNLREINLSPFTDVQLGEFLQRSFFDAFPRESLKKVILQHADLLPGNILSFIKDLILLRIIRFDGGEIKIRSDEKSEEILKSSQEEIYQLRLNSLTQAELAASELISAFETALDIRNISVLSNKSEDEINHILTNLQNKNIIQKLDINSAPVFTSEGLKKFVYVKIANKKDFHSEITGTIGEKIPHFNRLEFSRQLELAENYKESYLVLRSELEQAESISAYSYEKNILSHLLEIPLEEDYVTEIKYDLAGVLFRMSDYNAAFDIICELEKILNDEDRIFEISSMKGSCLIGAGKLEEGKKYLEEIVGRTFDEEKRTGLLAEVANAEFQLNRFREASDLCREIIENKNSSAINKGKCLNYLGLIEIYRDNNLDGALLHFEKAEKIYEVAGLPLRVAQMQMNMGNIYNIKGDHEMAGTYWDKSLEMNKSIGNLDQEAKLLLNFGVLNFDNFKFERSIEFYQRASSIFLSLGNSAGHGLVLTNLGEIYLIICEYEKAVKLLNEAKNIFDSAGNFNEYLEAFFILGKTYFAIGDYNTFKRLLDDFREKVNQDSIIEKHRNNFKFLLEMHNFNSNESYANPDLLSEIRDEYLKLEDNYNFFASSVLLVRTCIHLENFARAIEEINNDELKTLCRGNGYFEAERLYINGVLAEVVENSGLKKPMDYYQGAYEIVTELDITEITWKILYALTVFFAKRGNLGKAEEYLTYARGVIEFLTEKIADPRLKMVYLDEPDRHSALETLNQIAEQL